MLIDRLARDSRKFNVRALFASQLAGDLLRVPGFASLVNAVFVGRTDDEEAQAEALRLLRVPTGMGYEQMLGTLSQHPRDDRPDTSRASSSSPTATAAWRTSGSICRPRTSSTSGRRWTPTRPRPQ